MGHEYVCRMAKANSKEGLRKAMYEAEDMIRENSYYDYITIAPTKDLYRTFESEEEAQRALYDIASKAEENEEEAYSLIACYKRKRSAKFISLQERLDKEKGKLAEYEETHSVKNFKAKFVSCPRCESKINKVYLRNREDICPVCLNSLQSETTANTIKRYKENIERLRKELETEKKEMSKKKTTRANDEICYIALVVGDGHC